MSLFSSMDNGCTPQGPFYGPQELLALLSWDPKFQVLPQDPMSTCVRLRDIQLSRAIAAVTRYYVDGWIRLSALRRLTERRLDRSVSEEDIMHEVLWDPLRFEACTWTDGRCWIRATYRH